MLGSLVREMIEHWHHAYRSLVNQDSNVKVVHSQMVPNEFKIRTDGMMGNILKKFFLTLNIKQQEKQCIAIHASCSA